MKRVRLFFVMLLLGLTINVHAQQEHVVQRGEDFASIARKYAITEQELMNANPTVKECYIGRKLNIPQHGVPFEQKATPKLEKPTHVDPVRQFSFDPRKFLFFAPFKCPG